MNRSTKLNLSGALIICSLTAFPTFAAQHALVVGVNDYQTFAPYDPDGARGVNYDLLGAVNDANLLAFSLQQAGVSLPEDRILVNERATVSAFLDAWDRMKAEAAPGDTLIVTFAGHGAQAKEMSAPFDEADGLDEMIMFHEFDPSRPGVGRLTDDELHSLLADAAEYKIIWVMDSCHAGGLTRSVPDTITTLSRFGGLFDGLPDPTLANVPLGETGDGTSSELPHVTQILATDSELLRINETRIDGEMHGALSWHFAEALSGAADNDGNQVLSRGELRDFLRHKVFTRMNQTQQPSILPADDSPLLLSLRASSAQPETIPPEPSADIRIPVNFVGGRPPGLDRERTERVPVGARLTFSATADGKWEVYNHTGDRVTTLATQPSAEAEAAQWPDSAEALIKREEALLALEARVEASGFNGGSLTSANHGATLWVGEIADFTFTPANGRPSYLTLFNIAANGVVQPLFPFGSNGLVQPEGLTMSFDVKPPVGADRLVAVSCPEDISVYRARLNASADTPATSTLFTDPAVSGCGFTSLGLFTGSRN